MKKNIIVTGAAGFIGTNFVKEISTRNIDKCKFILIDNLTYAGEIKNIQDAVDAHENIEFHKIDICDYGNMKTIFTDNEINGVINFAAESHVDNSIKNLSPFVTTNILGTINLLQLSLEHYNNNKSFRYLQISTDEVYGSLTISEKPFSIKSQIAPSSPYSASKASADHFVEAYSTTFNLPCLITRCSNNYGPFQHKEKLIPTLLRSILKKENLKLYGDGSNIRDWIHVKDHCLGVWNVFNEGIPGSVYLLGGGNELSNNKLANIIKQKMKSQSKIEYIIDRKGHDYRYSIDYSETTMKLGWKPEVTFEEGINETIDWYLQNKNYILS